MFSVYDFSAHSIIRRLLLSHNMSIEGTNVRTFEPYFNSLLFSHDSIPLHGTRLIQQNQMKKTWAQYQHQELLERTHLSVSIDHPWKYVASRSIQLVSRLVNDDDDHNLGRSFAVVSTEGVLIYSVDNHRKFQPRRLVEKVTPKAVRDAIQDEKYHKALYMSLILNDNDLVENTLNSTQYKQSKCLLSATEHSVFSPYCHQSFE